LAAISVRPDGSQSSRPLAWINAMRAVVAAALGAVTCRYRRTELAESLIVGAGLGTQERRATP
jgi:hypothetical protein